MKSKYDRIEKRIAQEMKTQGYDINDFGYGEREFRNRVDAEFSRENAKNLFRVNTNARVERVGGIAI